MKIDDHGGRSKIGIRDNEDNSIFRETAVSTLKGDKIFFYIIKIILKYILICAFLKNLKTDLNNIKKCKILSNLSY